MVAYRNRDGSRASDLWLWDLPTGTPSRLTSSGDAGFPVVAPDGKSLAFFGSAGGLPAQDSGWPRETAGQTGRQAGCRL
jgi:Tol biopolymer transport system component